MPGLIEQLRTHCANQLSDELVALDKNPGQLWGAIVGGRRPSRYSLSPRLWNLYASLRNLPFLFIPLDLPDEKRLFQLLEIFLGEPDFLDLTVTDPFKKAICDLTERYQPLLAADFPTESLGSLNHLIRTGSDRNSSVKAINSDGGGMLSAIRRREDVEGRVALILGAGGAARSIGFALLEAGCNLIITNAFADELAQTVNLLSRLFPEGEISSCNFEALRKFAEEADFIINTVPEGCPLNLLEECSLTKDPLITESLYGGKESLRSFSLTSGFTYFDGKEMLFEQFRHALEEIPRLSGSSPDEHDKALKKIRHEFLSAPREGSTAGNSMEGRL